MFTSIVVAYDGSAHASKALEVAAGLAAAEQARLGIICVVDAGHAHLPGELEEMGRIEHLIDPMPKLTVNLRQAPTDLAEKVNKTAIEAQQASLQLAEYLVTEAARQARELGAQNVDATTVTGAPAEAIIEYANDLIVCGSRGLGRIKQLLLGSTSHRIAQLGSCSCLTVR